MEVTMNPENATTRKETGKTATEPGAVNTIPEHRHEDMVYRGEFRLLLGVGTFALAAILGGFAFFYAQFTDFRSAMDMQFADLRVAMEKEHAAIRLTMEKEHAGIRLMMEKEHADIRLAMETEHSAMLEKIYDRMDNEHDDLVEKIFNRMEQAL